MTIIISKQRDGKFVAKVDDPVITYISESADFKPFRDGISTVGNTWGEAFGNIKMQIDRYISVYKNVTGELPGFIYDGNATIINENINYVDLLK